MQQLIVIGLCAFWLTSVLRRFSRIESLAMAGVKPWACNACMSFWTMLPGAAFYSTPEQFYEGWPLFLAASGLCFFLLEFLSPPPPPLPPPPPDAR